MKNNSHTNLNDLTILTNEECTESVVGIDVGMTEDFVVSVGILRLNMTFSDAYA